MDSGPSTNSAGRRRAGQAGGLPVAAASKTCPTKINCSVVPDRHTVPATGAPALPDCTQQLAGAADVDRDVAGHVVLVRSSLFE